MSTGREARIATDHILAEIAAFPLTSDASLALGLTELDPQLEGSTRTVWRAAENALASHFPAFSIDEVVALRDFMWFGPEGQRVPVPLWRYLSHLARQFLDAAGLFAVPRTPDGHHSDPVHEAGGREARARTAWRWLSFAIPPDVLLAALAPDSELPGWVSIPSPPIAQLLSDRGFAETHLHVGAGMDFAALWISAQHALADAGLRADAFLSPGAGQDEGRLLGPWLLRGAIARLALARFLACRTGSTDLQRHLLDDLFPLVERVLGLTWSAALRVLLSELSGGKIDSMLVRHAVARSLYARLSRVSIAPFPATYDDLLCSDPIRAYFPAMNGRPTSDMRFLAAGISYLRECARDGSRDPLFERLFYQLVRVQSLLYRHLVQRPMTPGMQWFIRFYARIKPTRRHVRSTVQIEGAALRSGLLYGLRSLEIRTAPDPSSSALLDYVRDVEATAHRLNARLRSARQIDSAPPCLEVGLVLHFNKDRGGGAVQGHPRAHSRGGTGEPTAGPLGVRELRHGDNLLPFRYASFYQTRRREAISLGWVLHHFPAALQWIRGVDVCTDELGVPTWVMAPLVNYVRAVAKSASRDAYAALNIKLPRLRTTIHAGEDFVHLLGGLRRVDEAIRFLGLAQGDRIGHGVALGVDPIAWARQAGRLALTREERLFDLTWEWAWHCARASELPATRLPYLDREIRRLAHLVFGGRRSASGSPPPRSPFDMERLYLNLHQDRYLADAGFPSRTPWRESHLHRYLSDPEVYAAGQVMELIDPESEGHVLAIIQNQLRDKVGRSGLTIEINPTSNLLIANLGDLTHHPLWRLCPPRPQDAQQQPVAVCIGSDDPTTFANDLRAEYQLLHDALVLGGVDDDDARRWLDRCREAGLEARFTLPGGRHRVDSIRQSTPLRVSLPP